jgi:hypothetical protein
MASLDDYRKQELMKRSGIDTYAQGPFAAAAKQARTAAAPQPGLIQRAFPNTLGAMSDRRSQIDAAQKAGGMGAAFGQSARTVMNPLVGFVEDSANMVRGAIDPAAQALKTFATGDATPIGQEPQNPIVRAAMPKPAAPMAPTAQTMGAGRGAVTPPMNPVQQQAPAAVTNPLVREITPGIFRQGNSFSDTAAGASEGARPAPISAQNMAAADALAARSQAQALSNPLVQAAAPAASQNLTPADTGQGYGYGLLNSNRLAVRNAAMDVQQMKPGSGTVLKSLLQSQADAPNQQIERDKIAQRGNETAADRQMRSTELMAKMGESSADRALRSQEVADNSLVNAAKREAMGVETGAARRLAKLQDTYLNAKTPQEQAAAAAKINALSGKTNQDEYMAVAGGQTVDAMGNITKQPDLIVNKRTGQPVQGGQQAQAPKQALPPKDQLKAGTVYQTPRGAARWDGTQFIPV